jgi:hypothetical protein
MLLAEYEICCMPEIRDGAERMNDIFQSENEQSAWVGSRTGPCREQIAKSPS